MREQKENSDLESIAIFQCIDIFYTHCQCVFKFTSTCIFFFNRHQSIHQKKTLQRLEMNMQIDFSVMNCDLLAAGQVDLLISPDVAYIDLHSIYFGSSVLAVIISPSLCTSSTTSSHPIPSLTSCASVPSSTKCTQWRAHRAASLVLIIKICVTPFTVVTVRG